MLRARAGRRTASTVAWRTALLAGALSVSALALPALAAWSPALPVAGCFDATSAAESLTLGDGVGIFAVGGSDDALYAFTRPAGSGTWSGGVRLGQPPPGWIGDPSLLSSVAPNRIDVFVTGTDGDLWQRFGDSTLWFEPLFGDGELTSGPQTASRRPGQLDLVGLGTDGRYYHRSYDLAFGWSAGWVALPPNPAGMPRGAVGLVARPGDRLEAFAVLADNTLWQSSFHGGVGWSPWYRPPGTESGRLTSDPDAASWGDERVSVIGVGTDGRIYTTSWTGAAWTPWVRAGGPGDIAVEAPALRVTAQQQLETVVIGTDDRCYYLEGT